MVVLIIFIELMTSDRNLQASREGLKWGIYGTLKTVEGVCRAAFFFFCIVPFVVGEERSKSPPVHVGDRLRVGWLNGFS